MKKGFTTFEVAKAIGVKYPRLRSWLEIGAIPVSVQQADGAGTKRLFTFFDTCMIGLFRELLESGLTREDASVALDNVTKVLGSTKIAAGGKFALERDRVFYFKKEHAIKFLIFFKNDGNLVKFQPDGGVQMFDLIAADDTMVSSKSFLDLVTHNGLNPCAFDSVVIVNFKRIVEKISVKL